jgi:glucokinase
MTLINDFGAVGHAVVQVEREHLRHLCGPDVALPEEGVISIVGPGSGLGVAHVLRRDRRDYVIECEGGHMDYAPVDGMEDVILARLRERYGRVSVERVVSGPGLAHIYEALAAIEDRPVQAGDDKAIWTAAFSGADGLAMAALDRFCLILGSVAGNIALAHGATAVVIAGGLGARIAEVLPRSGFSDRFTAKGRFEKMMSAIPVKIIVHPQPGLFGAAVAFAAEHGQ